jgi:hypothetical protein
MDKRYYLRAGVAKNILDAIRGPLQQYPTRLVERVCGYLGNRDEANNEHVVIGTECPGRLFAILASRNGGMLGYVPATAITSGGRVSLAHCYATEPNGGRGALQTTQDLHKALLLSKAEDADAALADLRPTAKDGVMLEVVRVYAALSTSELPQPTVTATKAQPMMYALRLNGTSFVKVNFDGSFNFVERLCDASQFSEGHAQTIADDLNRRNASNAEWTPASIVYLTQTITEKKREPAEDDSLPPCVIAYTPPGGREHYLAGNNASRLEGPEWSEWTEDIDDADRFDYTTASTELAKRVKGVLANYNNRKKLYAAAPGKKE